LLLFPQNVGIYAPLRQWARACGIFPSGCLCLTTHWHAAEQHRTALSFVVIVVGQFSSDYDNDNRFADNGIGFTTSQKQIAI
jgi:hypothetical protein